MILYLCAITDTISITCTKTLLEFQIISKLTTVKSCECLSEIPGIELKGSIIPINGAGWSAMHELR